MAALKVGTAVGSKVGSLGGYIREQRETAQVSLRQLARTAGVSNPYLSQIERGLKKPSAEILAQIAKGLRISAETLYVHAGFLDAHDGGDVVAAIHADTAVGDRHKRVLLDIYESFRAEHAGAAAATSSTGARKAATKKAATKKAATKKAASRKAASRKASLNRAGSPNTRTRTTLVTKEKSS